MRNRLKLEITRPDGDTRVFDLEPGVYTIGRDPESTIYLPADDVESRHAVLTVREENCSLDDLDSQSGTLVNGSPIKGRVDIPAQSGIKIGKYALRLFTEGDQVCVAKPPVQEQPGIRTDQPSPAEPEPNHAPDPLLEKKRLIKQQVHKELVTRLDLKRLAASHMDRSDLRERASATVSGIVEEISDRLPSGVKPEALIKEICDEALGLGPLEDFLADPEVTEIMVNGPSSIYLEKKGKLVRANSTFMNASSVLAVIERIVSPIGRRIDESQPYVDARLPDGSRVNAIIHPLSLTGPCITIRKFSKTPFTEDDLIRFGTLTHATTQFLRVCVLLRKNIVVSGGTGSGKTTLLNALSDYLPVTDRIVTIEDAAELRLGQDHVVRLESRPPNIEGKGAITIRDLVRNSLRMRPDRIVVGECRGGEALDMLQAMNTGHDGSLTTIHANSPRDVISRLETMVLMSGMDLPVRAIREQVASALDLIVHEARLSDGSRRVVKITEVVGLEGDQITMQDLFEFKQTGVAPDGTVQGSLNPTGSVPAFIDEIRSRGLTLDRSIFDPMQHEISP